MSCKSNDSIPPIPPDLTIALASHEISRRSALRHMLLAGAVMPAAIFSGKEAFAGAAPDAVVFKIVTYELSPEWFERFLASSAKNAEASRKEPGVLQFEVLIPEDTPNTVMFIEVYRNAAASESHRQTPHFLAFMEGVQQSKAKRSAVTAMRYASAY